MLCVGLLALFAGYPIITFVQKKHSIILPLGVNASGQVPQMTYGNWGLVDQDTPDEAYTKKDWKDGKDWVLVFSDEFNQDGRTFYPGDDPVRPYLLSYLQILIILC